MQRVSNVSLAVTESESALIEKVAKKQSVKVGDIKYFKIVKKSLDARKKNDIKFVYTVDYSLTPYSEEEQKYNQVSTNKKVAVIGLGPAGLFCALTLARHGVSVTVFERGDNVDNRTKAVNDFCNGGALNLNVNVQFGEGGAGTFSDGKLNTGVNDRLIGGVLRDFVKFGAPTEIEYLAKPHIGSDKLKSVVKAMRNHIIELGGKVCFNSQVTDFNMKNGVVCGVEVNGEWQLFDDVVLAVGHSARDTFETLFKKGVQMEQKEFAVGFRVEQLQSVISLAQYGKFADHPNLKSADYKLVSHASERAVFTFCMCPGGVVMPSTSEEGCVVTNGMSNYLRNEQNANSAIIAQVRASDFTSRSPLAGIEFQRAIERKAFCLGGEDYTAPVQLATDFCNGVQSSGLNGVKPTYARGYKFARLDNLLPNSITKSIQAGLLDMDNKLCGIATRGAVLTGVESRTSSPLRIVRDQTMQSVNCKNLYPCGEGCGYAGGIMSASVDGIKVAQAILQKIIQE